MTVPITWFAVRNGRLERRTPYAPPPTQNLYGPVTITAPSDLDHAPDADYVTWSWARSTGMTLDAAFQTLSANQILVLPEDEQPYEIDSSQGFRTTSWFDTSMCRGRRGLVGLGPGAVVQPSVSGFTQGRASGTAGNQNKMLSFRDTDGIYVANFTMHGRPFGGCGYDAIKPTNCTGGVFERLYLRGAHYGWQNYPPGECGGINVYQGTNYAVYNTEVDCRDANGLRVGTSPVMWNRNSDMLMQDCYLHHAVAGMPTIWNCSNLTTKRVRSEYNGSGSGAQSGSGFNHEQTTGWVRHEDIVLIVDRPSGNTGLHFSISTNQPSATFTVTNPSFDKINGDDWLKIQYGSHYQPFTQQDSDIHITDDSGDPVPFRTYN